MFEIIIQLYHLVVIQSQHNLYNFNLSGWTKKYYGECSTLAMKVLKLD